MSNDFDDLVAAMKADKDGGGVKKFWSPPSDKEGNFPIRILQPLKEKDEKLFYLKHKVHFINKRSYECLRQTFTDKNGVVHTTTECPICNFVSKLYDSSVRDSDEWKLASSLRSQDRYIYRVVVRGSENETQPVFYESGKTIFEMLYHIIAETDFGNITSLKDGRDFNLSKKGVGRMSKYETSTASANKTPVFSDPEDLKKLVANMKKMDYHALLEYTSAEDLRKILKTSLDGGDSSAPADEVKEEKLSKKMTEKAVPPKEDEDELIDDGDDIDDILNDL